MTKTFPIRVLLYVLLLAVFTHGLNFAIDPLQIYRKQELLTPLFTENQRLQVPGLARNYASQANTLIIGSSMTANFRSTQVDEQLGGSTLKLSVNGSTAYEQLYILRTALESQKGSVNSVLWGIDLGRFNESYGEFSQPVGQYPIHLYKRNAHLLRYTLSLQTTLHSIRTLISSFTGISFPLESQDINSLNTWNRLTGCGPVLQHLDTITRQEGFLREQGYKFRAEAFASHVSGIVEIAKAYPDVKFVLFYSPYSIVRYKRVEQLGGMEHFIRLRREFFDRVDNIPNIGVIDVQAEESIITNLDYYKDVGHYDDRVNSILLQQILTGQFASKQSLLSNSARLLELVRTTELDYLRESCLS